ncbi:MAG: hypothetical protein V3U74_04725 [Thermodesulfobacteriota bacterium]
MKKLILRAAVLYWFTVPFVLAGVLYYVPAFGNGDGVGAVEESKTEDAGITGEEVDGETEGAVAETEEKVKPNPKRTICSINWNAYYKKEKVDIIVSTRGEQDEIVVFFCSICTLEDHFIEPFLTTEYQDMTGMDRIKECGFTQAVFAGGQGINEVTREVPK